MISMICISINQNQNQIDVSRITGPDRLTFDLAVAPSLIAHTHELVNVQDRHRCDLVLA
jgi:hypothetical protein